MTSEMRKLCQTTLSDLKKKYIVVSDDTTIDSANWKGNDKVKQYALDQTKIELEQAVEGLYHNLNTLNLGSLTK